MVLKFKHRGNINDEKDTLIKELREKLNKRNKKVKFLEERIRLKDQIIHRLKHSYTYKTGRFILLPFILAMNIIGLLQKIGDDVLNLVRKELRSRFPFLPFLNPALTDKIVANNKKVIFTVILGDYDNLKEPDQVLDDWDYICFTNRSDLRSENWQIVRVNCPQDLNLKRCTEYFTIYPFRNLSGYELSVLIGGQVSIQCDLNDFVNDNLPADKSMAVPLHPVRECIYDEALKVKELKKDSDRIVDKQMKLYKLEGFPSGQGLIQAGIMIRRHNDTQLMRHCKLWLQQVIMHSQRDQLSFNYVLWKHRLIEPNFMDPDVFTTHFKIHRHNYKQEF